MTRSTPTRRPAALGGVLALLLAGAAVAAEDPAVARPSFPIDGEIQSKGLVFFVLADTPTGAAAVGTAHSFDLGDLSKVRRGDLTLGKSRRVAAKTSGFLVPPGQPFNTAGATLSDDYVVYALDREPAGVRLLGLDPGSPPARGTRVEILGIPASSDEDEVRLAATVEESSDARIEVDLLQPFDLRGWGGAPVVDARSGRVVGMLQAYFPQGSTSRVIVSPIASVREALASPLEGGAGKAFASFRPGVRRDPAQADGGRSEPLIRGAYDGVPRLHLTVEFPPEGAVVSDSACGVFVAGRAVAQQGNMRQFDVMLVIDSSRSTIDPSGADINGNGIVGKPYLGRIGSIFDVGSTDPGDSILAAEVAAARQLLRGLDPRSTRVGVVDFSGDPPDMQGGGIFARSPRPPARTLEPLTNEYARVERALDAILARDPSGSTHMAAGVDQATIELIGLRGALSRANNQAEKIVLFFTDGQPTLPYGPGFEADNVRAVLRAANRADRAQIQIHSFAIGPDALDGPVATVEMAARTNGFFTPVRHPGDLVNVVESVSFANLEDVVLRHVKTGAGPDHFRTTADGSWSGFVRMDAGRNELEVTARSSDGLTATERVAVTLAGDAPELPLPKELVTARNRLLEDCLRSLKEVRMTAEREAAEAVRKDLLVEIERERARARERADEQRKRLQLEVDSDDVAP